MMLIMSNNNAVWYYRNNRKKEGAFTEEELIKLIQKGILETEDEIWMLEMENWMKLADSIYSFYLKNEERQA